MNCSICHREFQEGERITANVLETFIFKPAGVPDVKMYEPDGKGGVREINAAAVLSPEALKESRKDHVKTVTGSMFILYGKAPIPEKAFNIKHAACGVNVTGTGLNRQNPMMKHEIRFYRKAVKR